MLRIPVTSTVLIFLPTTSRSRSRRPTSTSGSSGIRAPHRGSCPVLGSLHAAWRSLARRRLGTVLVLHGQPAPGGARRRLLGLLLRAALALPPGRSPDQDGREEALGVVRSLVGHLVARELLEPAGGQLLQPRLVV